jgi:hypothetical protein
MFKANIKHQALKRTFFDVNNVLKTKIQYICSLALQNVTGNVKKK